MNGAEPPGEAYRRYRRALRLRRAAILTAQVLILAAAMLLWELAAERQWVNPMLTSRPSKVWETLLRLAAAGSLWKHLLATLRETLVGFAAGMLLGVAAAVALWWWEPLAEVLDPYLVVLNAMPKIALGPIFYIWLGAANSVYGMAVAISVVVTIAMVYVGFREVDSQQLLLMRTFGATRRQMLTKVVFPASLPTLMATLKVNIGLTLVGVIVGEFISSRAGLGYLIIYGGQVFQMELVMTSVVLLAVISALMYLTVAWAERLVARLFHLPVRGL
jgi:NitT/TauT family transport system permease protein